MAQKKAAREIKLVDVINTGGSVQRFEIVVGTDSVRRYEVKPGEVVQVEDGYTVGVERARGRRKSVPILQQLAPHMRRVDELKPDELARFGKARKTAASQE